MPVHAGEPGGIPVSGFGTGDTPAVDLEGVEDVLYCLALRLTCSLGRNRKLQHHHTLSALRRCSHHVERPAARAVPCLLLPCVGRALELFVRTSSTVCLQTCGRTIVEDKLLVCVALRQLPRGNDVGS